jgi:hypothetical protein
VTDLEAAWDALRGHARYAAAQDVGTLVLDPSRRICHRRNVAGRARHGGALGPGPLDRRSRPFPVPVVSWHRHLSSRQAWDALSTPAVPESRLQGSSSECGVSREARPAKMRREGISIWP